MTWQSPPDTLGTGEPGSGTNRYSYQVRRCGPGGCDDPTGGTWSNQVVAHGASVWLEEFAAGEQFEFRVQAVDAVNLVSPWTQSRLQAGVDPTAPRVQLSGGLFARAGQSLLPRQSLADDFREHYTNRPLHRTTATVHGWSPCRRGGSRGLRGGLHRAVLAQQRRHARRRHGP